MFLSVFVNFCLLLSIFIRFCPFLSASICCCLFLTALSESVGLFSFLSIVVSFGQFLPVSVHFCLFLFFLSQLSQNFVIFSFFFNNNINNDNNKNYNKDLLPEQYIPPRFSTWRGSLVFQLKRAYDSTRLIQQAFGLYQKIW